MLCARVAAAAADAINRLPKARIGPTRFSLRQMATLSLLDNDKSCAPPKMAHPQDRPEPRPAYKEETFCRFRDVLRVSFDARKTIAALVGGSSCCLTAQLHYNTVHLMTPERGQMPITRYV